MDATQDVFVQLLRHEHGLDERAPSSLLYRIATNVCLNRLRTKRRRPEHPDDDLLAALAHHCDTEGQAQARSFLGRLFRHQPESTATIAVMHWLDGMTLERVAEEVGMSVSGVRKRLRALREEIDRQQVEQRP